MSKIYAVTLRDKLVPSHAPPAGPIPIEFAYFLSKDPRSLGIAHRIDRAVKYTNESTLQK